METICAFFEPLGLAWLGLGVWLVIASRRRRPKELLLATAAWLILSLSVCTPLPSLLLASLETKFPAVSVPALENADAIVCLGGGASPAPAEATGVHLRGPADRITTALLLVRLRKAPTLVLGGGRYLVHNEWRSEADAVREALDESEFATAEIVSLGICANTRDEALKVAQLARERGWNRMHLVSSAYHLPRAVATFQRTGVEVIPVPCNFQTGAATGQTTPWITPPGMAGLQQFHLWIHEFLGGMYYLWRGWT